MITVAIHIEGENEEITGTLQVRLDEFLVSVTNPEVVEHYTNDEISEAMVTLNETASRLLIEAQRRGILEDIMKRAMELQGAPKKG